ncbi:MAG TPA: TetR/AcrR family transcriptional regulator [Lacunisphaera sp.]|nr:TetR/AcrR family transcriptional regulator [Lacunisphaera sp.]
MKKPRPPSNQELRTRKDLLLAAGRLVKQGRKPNMDEIAQEALVSRATAYRCFRNVETLLAEVPVDEAVGDPAATFLADPSGDIEERIDAAEAAMHKTVFENEAQLRVMLSHSIGRNRHDTPPTRQNRRGALIEAALAPARDRFRDADYRKLCAALALIFGTESMIVFRDVIGLDERAAREVKSWAVRALVRAALQDAGDRPKRPRK